MNQSHTPSSVLMLGSVPLRSTQEVFTKVAASLPDRLQAIPDGETGDRWNYIGWQLQRFPPEMRRMDFGGTELPVGSEKPKYDIQSIQPTGYDEAAIASYAEFVQLRAAGAILPSVRFQIGLPTPINCVIGHIKPELQAEIEPLYEQRLVESLDTIVKHLPHDDIVIQWDLCFDMIALEYDRGSLDNTRFKAHFTPVKEGLLDRLERMCQRIPSDIGLAFHLCHGDLKHKHFFEPIDTGLSVEFGNEILGLVGKTHAVEWIHIPVPRDRKDVRYFKLLNRLKLQGRGSRTRLYLGLVHANDEGGSRERIKAASSVYNGSFGVATECGLGRTPVEEIESILSICKAVTQPLVRTSVL